MLHGMARDKGFRGAERDDLVQEVWLKVLRYLRRHEWQPRGSGLRGWLYRLLCNKACDAFRARKCELVRQARDAELAGVAVCTEQDAERWQVHCDSRLLEQLIAKYKIPISDLNRRLLTMLWIERRPRSEIAELLQLSPEQIKYRQYRVFAKLRAALAVFRGEQFSVRS